MHSHSPTLLVGATTTFGGFSGLSSAAVRSLNTSIDVIILTYYPLQGEAWHAAGNRLPFLSYFLLYDFDQSTCDELGTYYGSADPAFLSYLCTLGLRHSDGTSKPAWNAFVSGAQ